MKNLFYLCMCALFVLFNIHAQASERVSTQLHSEHNVRNHERFDDRANISEVKINDVFFVVQPANFVRNRELSKENNIVKDIKNLMVTGTMPAGTPINKVEVKLANKDANWGMYADRACTKPLVKHGIVEPGENVRYIKVSNNAAGTFQIYTLSIMGLNMQNKAQYEKWGVPTFVADGLENYVYAMSIAKKGDIIAVTKGDYELFKNGHDAPKPYFYDKHGITVRSISGNPEDVKLRGTGHHKVNGYFDTNHEELFTIIGASSGITLYGVTLMESTANGFKIQGSDERNITLDNCHLIDICEYYVKGSGPSNSQYLYHLTITNCLFKATGRTVPKDHLPEYGGNYTGAIDIMNSVNTYIANNVFIDIQGNDNTSLGAVAFWGQGGHSNAIVENNFVIRCDVGIQFGLTERIFEDRRAMTNAIVRNNIFYNVRADEIAMSNSDGIYIYNNTMIKDPTDTNITFTYSRGIRNSYGNSRNVVIMNNFTNNLADMYNDTSGENLSKEKFFEKWNIVIKNNLVKGQFDYNKYFVNAANATKPHDLKLVKAAVNAIDKGIPLTDVEKDFFGNARKKTPDIGAHEF